MSHDGRNVLAACLLGIDVTELHSPERVNAVCSEFGLERGSSFDLRTALDSNLEEHRRTVWKRIKEGSPLFVIGSPPCIMFSVLQALNPAASGEDHEAAEKFRQEQGKARKHIVFCCIIYKMQLAGGRHFLHEHPWGAISWDMQCMQELLEDKRVMIPKADLCLFGLETTDGQGGMGPARKRTGFMTSSWTVAEELQRTCDGKRHVHNPLLERRAKGADAYPPELCRATCRGVSRQELMDETGQMSSAPMSRGQVSALISIAKW